MQKIYCLIIGVSILAVCVSACHSQDSTSMIKSQRRFAKYMEEPQEGTVVDLSEGPKLRYNANFGPKNLDFDIKIKNPY